MLRKDSQMGNYEINSVMSGFYELPMCAWSVAIADVAPEGGHEAMAISSTDSARDPIRITPSSTTVYFAIRLGLPRSPWLLVISRHCPIANHCAVERHTGRRSVSSVRAIGATAGSSRRCGSPYGGIIAYRIVALFFGPIVLSVAWAVMTTWVRGSDAPEGQNYSQQKRWPPLGSITDRRALRSASSSAAPARPDSPEAERGSRTYESEQEVDRES